jgi:hypothetical protein
MRFFLDSNIMTYIAFFEGYLCEGNRTELDSAIEHWHSTGRKPPDPRVIREVEALRALYLIDYQAHFDWLFSDIGMEEIRKIRSEARRGPHYNLLCRLFEHRRDVFAEEGRDICQEECSALLSRFFPRLPDSMKSDALQYCEAELVESDYFLTNDLRFITRTRTSTANVRATSVSKLPFVASVLE